MQLPQSDRLKISSLCRLFDNKSECYKLFWFKAILTQITEGTTIISFERLINEMIADAWYMVTEYHLNLGPRDTLEIAVNYISDVTGFLPNVKKLVILNWLSESTDTTIKQIKRSLTLNVPFRLQAPFLEGFKANTWNCGSRDLISKINSQSELMYYFGEYKGLETRIQIQPEWAVYLKENQEIINGWLQYNMILYLQRRNPSVPGISDKLYPPQERKLEKVKKYWRMVSEVTSIREIYGQTVLNTKTISIDHFIPWSYVAHDEFWNLHPTTRSINSKKSNNLPNWELYFSRFSKLEYLSYQLIWTNDSIHDEFKKCAKDHLNNPEIEYRLFRAGIDEEEFCNQLKEVVYPVYQSALSCGFNKWEYEI